MENLERQSQPPNDRVEDLEADGMNRDEYVQLLARAPPPHPQNPRRQGTNNAGVKETASDGEEILGSPCSCHH
ncbi:hypothetical protein GUJ93_ZPchr0014g47655 [Zizania palustris]|uniref:Uncharacterized protein n=1 Tax=Zizania palustris TaxID=103762 RepID=A0A8J5THA8_ZIZPA|nr:hypothetical protein GUJ93_ZPchr0014g47655 [Zizania palustris]